MNFIKRKSPLRRIGPKGRAWIDARQRLKKEFFDKGILVCELKFPGCWKYTTLAFAHKYKRDDPRCEHIFEQVILACTHCHQMIEHDEELTIKMFKQLRPQ